MCFELSIAYSGTPPEEAPPWLTSTFDDEGSPGDVDLTLTATNLSESEFVGGWYFNLDPALDPEELVFSDPIVMSGSFDSPAISTGINEFKADGDGLFDILFSFETANDTSEHRFNAGDGVKYTISNIPSLTASSFNFISEPDGGQGEYPTAAHVQGISEGAYSGWVTIPEPTTIALLSLGALGLLKKRRK